MTKVVVDTNVLASGFAGFRNPSSIVAQLLRLWRLGRFELVTSEHILTELEHTLQSPYFRRRLSPEQISRAMSLLRNAVNHNAHYDAGPGNSYPSRR